MQCLLLQIGKKNQSTWHLYKQWLHNCYKFYEDEIETNNRQKTENAERKTLIFQKKGKRQTT